MARISMVMFVALLTVTGCALRPGRVSAQEAVHTVNLESLSGVEHLGHDTNENSVHTVWIDGVRARVVGTGEPFVIFWVNSKLEDTPFRFAPGKRATVTFVREIQDGVMGYEGKCIDLEQVREVTPGT